MPQPDGTLIPVYMTGYDWKQIITELEESIYQLTNNGVKNLPEWLSIIKDNIERQTGL